MLTQVAIVSDVACWPAMMVLGINVEMGTSGDTAVGCVSELMDMKTVFAWRQTFDLTCHLNGPTLVTLFEED